MSSESKPIDYRSSNVVMTPPNWMPRGIEWLWWGLLLVSIVVGFGMTIFAPT